MPLPASGGRGSSLQSDFWRWLLNAVGAGDTRPIVIAGDLNTCTAADGAGRDLACAENLRALQARGWRSAFRAVHPDALAHSWWHHMGSGFRIDDAYVSPGFSGAVRAVEYVAAVGEHHLAWNRNGDPPASTISDHAALVVDFDVIV